MRKGDTILFEHPPAVIGWGSAAGKKESEGPLSAEFDALYPDTRMGQTTWEAAEQAFARSALETALQKSHLRASHLDGVFAGDLQCQCTASGYLMRSVDTPFLGLYGACSTFAEGMGLAACFVAAHAMRRAAVCTSSHFCSAERQFRTPLDYGGKRTPTSQWTVTGAGCAVLSEGDCAKHPCITKAVFGRVRDFEVKDINNMGAAMAPAAHETLRRFFRDTQTVPADYDRIYTGDLGIVGTRLLRTLLEQDGFALDNHSDCGMMVFDRETQNVGAGGSGAGCSAAVFCAHILPRLSDGRMKRCLLLSTGALMSQITSLQGESIPGVAHLVEICAPLKEEQP